MGLARCRLEKRCYRCWSYDHVAKQCEGEEKSKACYRSALTGHTAKECKNSVRCPICREETYYTVRQMRDLYQSPEKMRDELRLGREDPKLGEDGMSELREDDTEDKRNMEVQGRVSCESGVMHKFLRDLSAERLKSD